MTREELKEYCEKQIQQFERVRGNNAVTLNDQKRYEAHKLILELLEQEPKWVPISEGPPKVADCYAVTRQIGSDLIVDACFFDGTNTWHNDHKINHERNYLTNIVAWMPLPEPYKVLIPKKESEE